MVSASQRDSVNSIVKSTIFEKLALTNNSKFVLMVSGGSDSTALAYIMTTIFDNKNLCICHINHMLRDEANDDETFVYKLANNLNVPLHSKKFDVAKMALESNKNIEALAREVRYKYAQDVAESFADKHTGGSETYIVTAHTLNDRVENFYMRSIVGTGPGGFAGMNYNTGNIIRPLLDITRDELENYILKTPKHITDPEGNAWRLDKTNEDTDYFRAYVRKKIIPLCTDRNPKALQNLKNSMNLIADENKLLNRLADNIKNQYMQIEENSFYVNTEIKNEELVLQKRAIYNAFRQIFEDDARINNSSINAVISAINTVNYKNNIQFDYAVHSTKRTVFVEPMSVWNAKRKRDK